jgi:hypothetical protein
LAKVGSGPSGAALAGGVFLGGPYHRAPFSLVMAFDAKIGPFDLGRVSFRAGAQIDARSGSVTVSTDRIPAVVEGIPIRFQAISFALDRKGLVHNPTGCGPHALTAHIESQDRAVADATSSYPVRRCKRLGFSPRVRISLAGAKHLRKGSKALLQVSARFRRGDTTMRALALELPSAFKLDASRLGEICSLVDAQRGLCGPGARVGKARARTALLDVPLRGSVYVVQPPGGGEPDLWTYLTGAGVRLSLRGETTVEHGRMLTKISGLPDLPMSEFSLRLGAGTGLLSFATDPCNGPRPSIPAIRLTARGQNGARFESRQPIAIGGRCE